MRIFYLGPQTPAGPNYLIPGGGAYFNAGGIDTTGIELSATVPLPRQTAFYTAYTFNNSAYIGSGDPLVDTNQGIVAGTDVTGVPARLWVVSLDRSGPLGMGLSAKYTSSRRVSVRSDWYADAYWLVDAYVSFSGEALSDLLRSTEFSIVANNLVKVQGIRHRPACIRPPCAHWGQLAPCRLPRLGHTRVRVRSDRDLTRTD